MYKSEDKHIIEQVTAANVLGNNRPFQFLWKEKWSNGLNQLKYIVELTIL